MDVLALQNILNIVGVPYKLGRLDSLISPLFLGKNLCWIDILGVGRVYGYLKKKKTFPDISKNKIYQIINIKFFFFYLGLSEKRIT